MPANYNVVSGGRQSPDPGRTAMDAACASSMAAVFDAAACSKRARSTGCLRAPPTAPYPATLAKFSAIGALSPTHSSPFDAEPTVSPWRGRGVLLLKRLSDAVRDEDEIYSVIRGIGKFQTSRKRHHCSSQRGIQAITSTARPATRHRPLNWSRRTDIHQGRHATELSTLSRLWTEVEGSGNVAVGSIKSQIGHLKAAAGIAGIIKSVMALHHRTIPPSANFETPNPTVDWSNIPFFVPTEPREWPRPADHPRRAGVSAFGFGGTNFHIALEGYEPDHHVPLAQAGRLRVQRPGETAAPQFSTHPSATMSHEEPKAIEAVLPFGPTLRNSRLPW